MLQYSDSEKQKQLLWIEDLAHLKQGLFLYQEDEETTVFACVCEQKYQKDTGKARAPGAGHRMTGCGKEASRGSHHA